METQNLGGAFPFTPEPAIASGESVARNVGWTDDLTFRTGGDPAGVRVLRP